MLPVSDDELKKKNLADIIFLFIFSACLTNKDEKKIQRPIAIIKLRIVLIYIVQHTSSIPHHNLYGHCFIYYSPNELSDKRKYF